MGTGLTASTTGIDIQQLEAIKNEKAETIQPELEAHKTFESWGLEGADLAKKAVYLNGELKLGRSAGRNTNGDNSPQAPADYAPAARRTAPVQVGKAGARLAEKIGELLR